MPYFAPLSKKYGGALADFTGFQRVVYKIPGNVRAMVFVPCKNDELLLNGVVDFEKGDLKEEGMIAWG